MAASGYRTYPTGALTNVGANGDYWSSSPQSGSVNAGHLNFNTTNVNPLNSNPRAYGFPVRCVQHLRRLFFIILSNMERKNDFSGPEWRELRFPPVRPQIPQSAYGASCDTTGYSSQSGGKLFFPPFIPAIALMHLLRVTASATREP